MRLMNRHELRSVGPRFCRDTRPQSSVKPTDNDKLIQTDPTNLANLKTSDFFLPESSSIEMAGKCGDRNAAEGVGLFSES